MLRLEGCREQMEQSRFVSRYPRTTHGFNLFSALSLTINSDVSIRDRLSHGDSDP